MPASRKKAIVRVVAFAASILLTGGALIRLGISKRSTEMRSLINGESQAAAYSLEQQLGDIAANLEPLRDRLRAPAAQNDLEIFATPDDNKIKGETLVFVSSAYAKRTDFLPASAVLCRDLNVKDWAIKTNTKGRVIELTQQSNGDWRVVMREPLYLSGESEPDGWLAGCRLFESLLQASDFSKFQELGLDYEIFFREGDGRQSRRIAGSITTGLANPVEHEVHSTGGAWLLRVAPRAGWTNWTLLIFEFALVLVLTLFASTCVYDFFRRSEQLQAEVEASERRLRDMHWKLSEESELREEIEQKLSHANFHDAATGLPNRGYFMERLRRALQHARLRPGYLLAVMVVSFDRFKSVSETLGASAGDELLSQAIDRLGQCLRPEDLVFGRLEGDQVAILLFDIGSAEAAAGAAKRLQSLLVEPFRIESQNVFTTANVGVALSASGYENAEDLLSSAHMALSKAKAEGRSQYNVYDSETREEIVARHQLETDLYQAIECNELFLNFQPIVSLATGCLVGMEALLRWQHPLEGVVPPAKFIPVAEETGLIVPITRWVLREACSQAAKWRRQIPANETFYFSVNLSVKDLQEPDICEYVAKVVSESGIPSSSLRLEITESVMMGNINVVSELVSRFRDMGILLLLDDFGTGYSSLSYLNRFHFDYIKIDQTFVRRLDAGGHNAGIVRAVVHLAEGLKSNTVAEGVESLQSVALLKNMGCNYGQGYYFSKPLGFAEMQDLLLSGRRWEIPENLTSFERHNQLNVNEVVAALIS